jgi:Zn-dependent M28 family amino/carboxypeptidase
VVLGAHLDSWDVGAGAQDDGAGVVTAIEAARRIGEMRQRPLRTLRVVLFANEEFGLSGARRYALDHESELARHAAAIEADLGSGRVFRFESRVRSAELPSVLRMAALLAPLGVPFTSNDSGGGADIGPMRERGVPAFGLQHDASKYFEIHHTDADRLDRVDASDLAFNVAAYATVAWALADTPTRFAPLDRTWPTVSSGVEACEWRP